MHQMRLIRSTCLTTMLMLTGLCLAAAASACPDAKPTAHCPPNSGDGSTETTLVGPAPDPDADAPLLSGVSGPAARFRDGDSHTNDNPLSWLLASGPIGGLRLATERLSRAPERKAGGISEVSKSAKPAARRGGKSRSGGAVGHIAKPHRMPSLEIL